MLLRKMMECWPVYYYCYCLLLLSLLFNRQSYTVFYSCNFTNKFSRFLIANVAIYAVRNLRLCYEIK